MQSTCLILFHIKQILTSRLEVEATAPRVSPAKFENWWANLAAIGPNCEESVLDFTICKVKMLLMTKYCYS